MLDERDPDEKKLMEIGRMLSKLNLVVGRDNEILARIDETTADQSEHNMEVLASLINKNQENLAELLPQLEQFEEEVAFVNEHPPLPEPITTDKTGLIEHAVIEQMERIDANQHQPVRYDIFNKQLSHKMCSINREIQGCISNALSKL